MFSSPENYGATNEGILLSDDDIQEVADVSGVIDEEHSVINIGSDTRQICVELVPNPDKIEARNEIKVFFRFLKRTFLILQEHDPMLLPNYCCIFSFAL